MKKPITSVTEVLVITFALVHADRRKADRVDLDEMNCEWEMKTITSALKNYFRYAIGI
jgi:hypothetical protein